MKSIAGVIALVAIAVAIAATPVRSAPKPSPVPVNWQLDIRHDPPRAFMVKLPGRRNPQLFWYFRYTVTNDTGQEVSFVPEFVLYTDTGQVSRDGQGVPTAVFKAVKKLHNDPLLKDRTGMTGRLLQGEDHAKDGVAIWRDFDPKAGAFDVFIGGLSGETAEIKLPKPIQVAELDSKGNEVYVQKDRIVISKALNLRYSIPGEAAWRSSAKIKLLKRQWVMR